MNGGNRMLQKKHMKLEDKLKLLNELVIDSLIEGIEAGEIKPLEMQGAITLLKNNKVVQETKSHSEADVIEGLIE